MSYIWTVIYAYVPSSVLKNWQVIPFTFLYEDMFYTREIQHFFLRRLRLST